MDEFILIPYVGKADRRGFLKRSPNGQKQNLLIVLPSIFMESKLAFSRTGKEREGYRGQAHIKTTTHTEFKQDTLFNRGIRGNPRR